MTLSGNAFRRMCRNEFLHYLRIREWQDLVGQLRGIARELGIIESDEPADRGPSACGAVGRVAVARRYAS